MLNTVGNLIAYVSGLFETLFAWIFLLITWIVKIILTIGVVILLANMKKGYDEAGRQEDFERWFHSLEPQDQVIFGSLAPEHKNLFIKCTPRFRQWFLQLTPHQRDQYLLRQKT